MSNLATLQRAYQLAQSGSCYSISDIEKTLERERHSSVRDNLAGTKIRSELKRLMKQAREAAASNREHNSA